MEGNKLDDNERRRVLEILDAGSKSEYWNVLKIEIERMREWEMNYMNGFIVRGLKESDREEYNKSVERKKCFDLVLGINEKMISEHKTVLEKILNAAKKKVGAFGVLPYVAKKKI